MMSSISKIPLKVRSCSDSINKINLMKIFDAIFTLLTYLNNKGRRNPNGMNMMTFPNVFISTMSIL